MTNEKPKTDKELRLEVLAEERVKIVRKIALLEIDIYILERTDPNTIVALEEVSPNVQKEIYASQYRQTKLKTKEMLEKRLESINILMKE